jgi:hypothetical protein
LPRLKWLASTNGRLIRGQGVEQVMRETAYACHRLSA